MDIDIGYIIFLDNYCLSAMDVSAGWIFVCIYFSLYLLYTVCRILEKICVGELITNESSVFFEPG